MYNLINFFFRHLETNLPEFKAPRNNHKKSCRHRKYRKKTNLSKLIWHLKENETEFDLDWSISTRSSHYEGDSRRCGLSLSEKATIIRSEPNRLLNKRTKTRVDIGINIS